MSTDTSLVIIYFHGRIKSVFAGVHSQLKASLSQIASAHIAAPAAMYATP